MFLKSRECGMHEAADHLSGDHLYEKSVTIQWVDVRMPHKRQRRVKIHAQLLKMESEDPENENIFTHNFLSTYYPQRPGDLEDICLHDFVANYSWHETDHKPFTMFVSGVGGTGKSFLIEAIKALVDSLWTSEGLKCAITAPTGLAAFNVGGVIHRLFQLPIEHEGKEAGCSESDENNTSFPH